MKDLLEYLAKQLVTKPKEVKITENKGADGTTHLVLSVAPDDMGIIIGKGGKTINAIRSLIKTATLKAGKKVYLELEEKEKNREPATSDEPSKTDPTVRNPRQERGDRSQG